MKQVRPGWPPSAIFEHRGLDVVHDAVAALATSFPDDLPADPADRLIAATARAEGVALVSRDTRIRASRMVDSVW